jgi:hypothetical protein
LWFTIAHPAEDDYIGFVGSSYSDMWFIKMSENAMGQMSAEKKLEIVPSATHLFEEPGALDTVALLASRWFRTYLAAGDVI